MEVISRHGLGERKKGRLEKQSFANPLFYVDTIGLIKVQLFTQLRWQATMDPNIFTLCRSSDLELCHLNHLQS